MAITQKAIPCFKLNDGHSLPVLAFGTWAYEGTGDREAMEQVVFDAICQGLHHIDTAWIYDIETSVGKAVKRAIAEGIAKREDLVIVTKIWCTNFSKDLLIAQAKESLSNLGLDYIDILLIHWPVPLRADKSGKKSAKFPLKADGTCDIDEDVDLFTETWPAMEQCVDLGITKSIGVSNFSTAHIETLVKSCRIRPVCNQVESHPVLPNETLIAACRKYDILVTAYRPLGASPKPQADGSFRFHDVRLALFESAVVTGLAHKYGKTKAQILIKFHVQRGVVAIFKTVTKSRIAENMEIFDFDLTEEDMTALRAMSTGQRTTVRPEIVGTKYDPFADE